MEAEDRPERLVTPGGTRSDRDNVHAISGTY